MRSENHDARRHQGGFTVVEMAIASALLVAIVSFTFGSVTAVTSVNEYGENRLQQSQTGRNVLHTLRKEFRRTTLEKDKKTNQPRFTTALDKNGNSVVTFSVLTGAAMNANEIEPRWSANSMVRLDVKTKQLLLQSGASTRILGNGIHSFQVGTSVDNRIRVVCETEVRDPKSGKLKKVIRRLSIRPLL